jgi:hypothetical protein
MNPLTIVIIVVVIVLVILILYYLLSDPNTLQGIQDGKTASKISASSLATNGSSSPATNFTYSIWFYVNDWNYKYGKPKIILGRMGAKSPSGQGHTSGVDGKNPSPAIVLGAIENNVAISVSCFPGQDSAPSKPGETAVIHTCSVANVPIQRWVNLLMSVYGRTLDVYLDGKLTRTCLLPGIVSVSKNAPVFVTPAGGFDGWTAKLQYWPDSFNPQQAWNTYAKGYKGGALSSGQYQLQISVLSNGATQKTYTLGSGS